MRAWQRVDSDAGLLAGDAVKATKTLRISEEGEREGIDIHEHGAPAYHPEPAYTGIAPTNGSGSSMAKHPAPSESMV